MEIYFFLKGAPVFVEGSACAMAQWHNGTMASPSLCNHNKLQQYRRQQTLLFTSVLRQTVHFTAVVCR